ncbi:MAG: AmpG-like permease [Betaproteobacteria bacterium]|nr:AmpG-like permease [Betaproteobacteria bacterium]
MQAAENQPRETVREALLNRRMLICVFLGFSSGLPLFIVLNLLQAWLRTEGVDLKTLGLFALIQFPYTWKFLWSPLMDRYALPLFGRRRGWMLLTQVLLLACIAMFGVLSPHSDLPTIALMTSLLAFLSASQDIVIDAYRREILPDAEQGLGTAIHVNAYKLAGLVPGSLALILSDHLPWSGVFWITALFMLPGIALTFLVSEPTAHGAPPKTLHDAVVLPFREFVRRDGIKQALLILTFIFFYKLGDSMATSLATAFYLDTGFTKTQIGLVAKNAGLWASVAGGLVGGLWMLRLGINRALWVFGAVQWVSILGFALLTQTGPDVWVLAGVIGFEAFGVGLGTAAFTAYMARATDPRYTATQFALFSSLASVPRTFANAATGYLVADWGWLNFFLGCTVLAAPGMLLLLKIAPWREAPAPASADLAD